MDDEIEFDRCDMPEPNAISLNGIRYESMPFGKMRGLDQNGGFIAAIHEASNTELWLLKIYEVIYDPEMEDDVQENFISELMLEGENSIRVINERGEHYLLNLETKLVTKLDSDH